MSERPTVLVIDDDAGVVEWLVDALDEEGFAVTGETSALRAIDLLSHRAFDLVVSDVEMPELRGLELLRSILRTRPRQLVVLITAFGSIDLAVESLRAGAGDFVAKPFRIEALSLALRRSLRERELRREISRLREVALGETPSGMAAVSRPMKAVVELARKAARSHLPVLVTGESGVGKGVLARFIHQESARASQRFVQLNCAALPAGLAEAELFGVRRGAFTDAKEDRRGVFGQAHLGTLFLDEVGELPLELQPKLLQALESGRVRPVGGSEEVPADVRIVAATNRDLASALRARAFREDLYHRLDVLRLDVPPLRERTDDIQGIVDQVLHTIGRRSGVHLTVSPEAMSLLSAHSWPGNVRELVNAIERAAALADHHVLTPDDFALRDEQSGDSFLRSALARELTLAELEREYVRRVLAKTGGHKGRAAKILGLDRRTLYRKAAELSLEELNSDDD
jgi:DNA-binding NtrC family response regulator